MRAVSPYEIIRPPLSVWQRRQPKAAVGLRLELIMSLVKHLRFP